MSKVQDIKNLRGNSKKSSINSQATSNKKQKSRKSSVKKDPTENNQSQLSPEKISEVSPDLASQEKDAEQAPNNMGEKGSQKQQDVTSQISKIPPQDLSSQNPIPETESQKPESQKPESQKPEAPPKPQEKEEIPQEKEDILSVNQNSIGLINQSQTINQAIENDERSMKKPIEHIEIDAQDLQDKNALLMTEVARNFDSKDLFTFHDLIVPNGKNAKLCLVNDPFNKLLRVTEIADHFSFYEPSPVIVLIGANTKRKVKLFAGLSRAALNCRAIIIDSGIQTGVERFCLRKNIELIGIAPESQIEYPKKDPEPFSNTLLTNGHSHFILLGKDDKNIKWGQEAKFKVNFAERLANGRKGAYSYKSKVVGVILGNIPNSLDEIMMFVERKWPLILIEDSELAQKIKEARNANDEEIKQFPEKIRIIGKYQKLIEIDDDSENLAASIHICLTLTF